MQKELTKADIAYAHLLSNILEEGDRVVTRNSETFSHFNLPNITFTEAPIVSVRKTQWKKAISEMEWFISGDIMCPENLLNWWAGQLNDGKYLLDGYPEQFRHSCSSVGNFDQVEFILNGLKNNPNSRRLLISMWNPGEMANITDINQNPNTPTCCHSIIVQFFVRNKKLHMKTYQRSADMLLGVPHNWIQSWAMLMYFAHHAGIEVGSMTWMWGDAHIYNEESHIKAAEEILKAVDLTNPNEVTVLTPILCYEYSTRNEMLPLLYAEDFELVTTIPKPTVLTKPKLL